MDSEHSVNGETILMDAMELGEARALIEMILHNWLHSKLHP
jgi:hypothetical protein